MKMISHFITITRHRHLVMRYCFRLGLFKQGLLHDLSKYSPLEFFNGAKYYQGIESPHYKERAAKGFSEAWMHHKGRNKHHSEYWVDYDMASGTYVSIEMPAKYLAEMVCDRLAASYNYHRHDYNQNMPLEYFLKGKAKDKDMVMHEKTREQLEFLLRYYADNGKKKLFSYMRKNLIKKKK